MKGRGVARLSRWLTGILCMSLLRSAQAADWYVATNGTGLGTSWLDATNNLQGAINAIPAGATNTVWVDSGVYEVGGVTNWPAGSMLTNRIAINKAITVRSRYNNPTNTIIKGAWDSPATTNGPAAVRCIYMAANSSLIGFTLTTGATLAVWNDNPKASGGGAYCANTTAMLSNCVITANTAYFQGGGAYYGTLWNCTLIGNGAYYGGGTYGSIVRSGSMLISNAAIKTYSIYPSGGGADAGSLYDSTLIGNSAPFGGGGAAGAMLSNCIVIGNSGGSYGGGVNQCTVYNSTISGNSSPYNYSGGGAYNSSLYNCTVSSNSAGKGGGVAETTLYNCLLTRNLAMQTWAAEGGGAYHSTLYNCTVASNIANEATGNSGNGGGAGGSCSLINTIVFTNYARINGPNWYGSGTAFTNACTTPASNGWAVGNIATNPLFVNSVNGDYHLMPASLCRNAGTNFSWMTAGADVRSRDLDGQPRIQSGPVDMGAFELYLPAGSLFSIR